MSTLEILTHVQTYHVLHYFNCPVLWVLILQFAAQLLEAVVYGRFQKAFWEPRRTVGEEVQLS